MYSGKIAVPPGGGGIRKKIIIFYSKMSLLTLLSLSNTEQSTKTQYFRHLYQYYQVQEG
jgi:hypothetical protein